MLRLRELTKKYHFKPVFQGVNVDINAGEKWAIIGQNGSGKSTILKVIAGLESYDDGDLEWSDHFPDELSQRVKICAPYTSPIMNLSTVENLQFLQNFHAFRNKLNVNEVFELLPEDKRSANKPLTSLSSGMLQRVKLLLSMLPEVPMVILDEPLSNLDFQGVEWYENLVDMFLDKTTVLVGSNDEKEYSFCTKFIKMGSIPSQYGKL